MIYLDIWRIIAFLLFILYKNDSFQLTKTSNRYRSTAANMAGGQVPMVPFYPEKGSKDYQWMDIYNALGRERTLFVGRYLDDENCNQLIASLVWLQGQDPKAPITMYMNIPGAMTKPALAVYDVMTRMTCPIKTINMGLTVGMGALLCSAGTSGQRLATPNARFLMSKGGLDDGVQGQSSHIHLMVKEVMKDNKKMIDAFSRLTAQPIAKLENDFKRDFYLTAPEAAAYGIVDEVMKPEQPIKMMRYRGSDDDVVGYGHFSETRKVKDGPADKVKVMTPYTGKYGDGDGSDYDEYAANEMQKRVQSGRIDPRSLKNGGGASRFANSRCRPPGQYKPLNNPPSGANGDDGDDGNRFANTGF